MWELCPPKLLLTKYYFTSFELGIHVLPYPACGAKHKTKQDKWSVLENGTILQIKKMFSFNFWN